VTVRLAALTTALTLLVAKALPVCQIQSLGMPFTIYFATDSVWRNPSQYASSLPVHIRPLARNRPTLEPKTSLTDKEGILVPPLHVKTSRLNSATAIRKAMYAERDRIRPIDPGPTLDFNEQDEIEDEEDSHVADDGGRGRRHALSILQARSVIPEAGMWRSMTS
jgi:hypothetical protein